MHLTYQPLVGEYIRLADGTVRRPINPDEFLFWLNLDQMFGLRVIRQVRFRGCLCSTCFMVFDLDPDAQIRKLSRRIPEPPPSYRPLLWETMILGGTYDGYQRRYRSERSARYGHALARRTMTGDGHYRCKTCRLPWARGIDAENCHHPTPVPDPYECPRCGAVSWNPVDLANRYCGRCHQYEDLANVLENLNLQPPSPSGG